MNPSNFLVECEVVFISYPETERAGLALTLQTPIRAVLRSSLD
jgi:hypothetical protein